jgi:hypothetical protein
MATATVYFNDVVGGIGWFAASVAGWVVCKQCLSVASICQVVGCVLSGHCRVSFVVMLGQGIRSRDTDAQSGRAPLRLSSYYMTGLGGLCPPQFGQVATGCRSIFVRWTTFAICAVWKRCSVTRRDRLPRFPCLRPATYKRGTPMRLMKLW